LAITPLLSRLLTSRGFLFRSARWASLRARCSLGMRSRLRMGCSHWTRSALGARLRARCRLLTNCRLRMILIRAGSNRLVRGGLILIRASSGRLVRRRLVLIRTGSRRSILRRLVLVRASRRRLIRRRLVLIRTGSRRSILRRLVLIRASRRRLIRRRLVLIRTGGRRLIFSRLVLIRTGGRRPIFSRLVLIRASGCRLVLGGLSLRCSALGGLVLGGLSLRCSALGGLGFGSLVLGGRVIGCSALRCHYVLAAKLSRFGGCSDRRLAMIHRRQQFVVLAGGLLMPCLRGGCPRMTLMCRSLFCSGWSSSYSPSSAVVANAASRSFVDYGFFVSVVNVRHIYVIHRAVVAELVVSPVSAFVAGTTVAIAIVNTAVETDSGTPVAVIPGEGIAAPTPITRSPEQAHFGRLDPCARHPEIAFITVSPVAGRPQITALRTHRLRVRYQFRRSDRDRHAELCERASRYGQYQKS